MEPSVSGVGVLDKGVAVLRALEVESLGLAGLVESTGFSRATTHRLATALETHGLIRRDREGRFALGPRLVTLGLSAAEQWPLAEAAGNALKTLRDSTGESAQLYVRAGDNRLCIASLESPHGLRTIVATGATLPLGQGSGGRVLAGDTDRHGWIASVEERETGVASVSAPVLDSRRGVVAAVSISGPVDRTSRDPGPVFGPAVLAAAQQIASEAGLS